MYWIYVEPKIQNTQVTDTVFTCEQFGARVALFKLIHSVPVDVTYDSKKRGYCKHLEVKQNTKHANHRHWSLHQRDAWLYIYVTQWAPIQSVVFAYKFPTHGNLSVNR